MSNDIKVEIVKCSPRQAEEWLEYVPHYQRRMDERQVKKLCIALENGEWRNNGATIVFNRKGELINGQHRLKAISLSGKTVQLIVVYNVDDGEDVFYTVDDSKARKVSDFLKSTHVHVTASVGRFLWMVENKIWPPSKIVVPHSDILRVIKKYENQISGAIEAVYDAGRLTGQASFCVFLAIYYTKIARLGRAQEVAKFFARLGDGLELKVTDPEYQLRKRFMKLGHGQELTREAARAITLKALNMRLNDEECTMLRFEPKREEFPQLIGLNRVRPDLQLDSFEELDKEKAKAASAEE